LPSKRPGAVRCYSVQKMCCFSAEYYEHSRNILEKALKELSAYKSWHVFDPGPRYPIDARYAAMPALTKKEIRNHFPDGFVPPDKDIKWGLEGGEIEFVKTSGTSDVSVTNIWNQKWWDESERLSWKLNSHAARLATGTHHEAILANPLNVGFISNDADLPIEKRRLERFLYLNEKTNPMLWTPAFMDRMADELAEFKPAVFEANPSLMAKLCRYIAERSKPVFQPGLIVLTYEYPSVLHYRQIRRVFGSPIASSYGSTETGYVFMQCEAGKFHQNSDSCRIDFQPLKPRHGGHGIGRILVTPLNNPWYRIIHFDVGDLVRLDESGDCPCGRNSGIILSAIEGSIATATLTLTGRLVTLRELDNLIGGLSGVDEYRLEQTGKDSYDLFMVSRMNDQNTLAGEASNLLTMLYGKGAKISVRYENAISPESTGKYRLAKADSPINVEDYLDNNCISEGK
jgi:phenylacetate-coenzyme A ligase PaaK-like adenylate-forming protein